MKKLVGYAGLIVGAISFLVFWKLALPDHALQALKEFFRVAVMLSIESFKILTELAGAAWKFLNSFLAQVHALWEQVNIPELSGSGWAMIWALGISLVGFVVYRSSRR